MFFFILQYIIVNKLIIGDDNMQEVSKEEILHIANLARLNLGEDEIEKYFVMCKNKCNFAP